MERNKFERMVELLTTEKEVGEKLLALSPTEASEALNELGFNISEEEMLEFCDAAKKAMEDSVSDEMSEDDLSQVAGGKGKVNWNALGAGMVFGAAATALGYAALVSVCMW